MKRLAILSVCGVVTAAASTASAAPPNCKDLPNPVFIESGDTQEPLLKNLGNQLAKSTAKPMTLVYNLTGSCSLISDMYAAKKMTVNLSYIPMANDPNAPGWTPAAASPQCIVDPAGQSIDVAISALFVSSCTMMSPPPGIGLISGPIQGYSFVVPKASSQQAIVAEEAYFTFGFGNAGMIAPWNDEASLFIRPPTKSTLLTLAANIGVPGAKWKGMPIDKSGALITALLAAPAPEKALGILGVELYDQHRDTLSLLAFQAYGQHHAFWPDSSPTSFDKRSLRDGHYLPWSPTVYLTAVDGNNVPTNPNVQYLTQLVLGQPTNPPFESEGLDQVVKVGLIPDCAMQVSRTADGGDLALYTPAQPCGCYFESKVPMGAAPAACMACMNDGQCGAGKCHHGYCEVQ